MDIQKLNNDFYCIANKKTRTKDVSFYTLMFALKAYFETYYKSSFHFGCTKNYNENMLNEYAEENDEYISCYIDIVIHLQHFFELEVKRILEKQHSLYVVDIKGKPLILHKLIEGTKLEDNEISTIKSVEFSEAFNRLITLVKGKIISDTAAEILVEEVVLLKKLNELRNATMHRGKRIMKYCVLDKFMIENVLPTLLKLIKCDHYKEYSSHFKWKGINKLLDNMISEGEKTGIDYLKLAVYKEIGRCKMNRNTWHIIAPNDLDNYMQDMEKKPYNQITLVDEVCPCCKNSSLYTHREIIDFSYDELGDETSSVGGFSVIHVPEYEEYISCAICGFTINSFIDFSTVNNKHNNNV